MKSTIRLSLAIAVLMLLIPVLAHAGVIITIDDRSVIPAIPITTVSGFDPATMLEVKNIESYDVHGEYVSTMLLANGLSISVNFIFMDTSGNPDAGLISDTLNIVFTGHTPTAVDVNNMSVDMHFRSDIEPFGLPTLTSPISMGETGSFQLLTNHIQQAGGPSDFSVSVASGVPEPGMFGLMLVGLAGVLCRYRHSRRVDQ